MTEEKKPDAPLLGESEPKTFGITPTEPAHDGTPATPKPSYVLLIVVAVTSLVLDLGTKWWALHALEKAMPSGDGIPMPREITPWLSFVLARNRGGAWGLLQSASDTVRRPFFLLISILAIVFIVSLYRRVHPQQHALRWGLPLVLGGALGNLIDRIRYSWVVDFIDYRAGWVRALNEVIHKISPEHAMTDHWPTYNVADIAICIGVGLMAIDMFTSRRAIKRLTQGAAPEPVPEAVAAPSGAPSNSPPAGPPA